MHRSPRAPSASALQLSTPPTTNVASAAPAAPAARLCPRCLKFRAPTPSTSMNAVAPAPPSPAPRVLGGAVSLKEATVPTPRLISSQELEFFRPHIEIKRDRQTSEVFEVLDAEGPYRSTREQLFSIGQMLRIRKGPLKGYLCRVVRIFRNDVTVKLDSLLKIVTVQADLLSVPANRGDNLSGAPTRVTTLVL
ncbi:4-alpha-glucanotransferase DPE2 [Zea mays]|uniref:4-alpha-glucanotransferase DPE2 n=1 Tax=Zea mays TaxID=4577 RepID=A0A1D6K2L8_MAIZE|nr:4-alpha-glucanotransferase DPE2 [Zea mays]ONL97920.1 4-alpha-glucanotransferase DPE2 [Zea mays]